MAESKKGASSAGNPKEKDSLLELDFGNDFLTSWKTTSITGDDAMDMDFGPISKVKKNAFEFKKTDIDFNLDGDFGKLSSFNIDMPDFDISSPIKKDATSKEKQKEESTSGKNKAKADSFSFAFDFNDLDNFSFKPNPKKQGAKDKKDEAMDNSPDGSVSKESGVHPPEENDSHDGETTTNPSIQVKAVIITSSFESQVGDDAAGSTTGNHLSNTNEDRQLSSTTAFDKTSPYKESTTFDTTTNMDKQQQDSQLQKVSPEQVSQDACIPTEAAVDVSVHSTSATESSRDTMPELQEDASSGSRVINQEDKQRFNKNEMVGSLSSSGSPMHGDLSLQQGTSSQNANDPLPNSADVLPSVGKKDGQNHFQFESFVGQSATSMVPIEATPGKHGQMKSQNLLDHSATTLGSGATASDLMPEKEKEGFTVRSKYFKSTEKSGDQLHNTFNQRKLSSLSENKLVARQQHHGDERHDNAKEDQNHGAIPDKSLAHLESRVSTEHSDGESQEGSQGSLSSRSLGEDVNKGKLVSRGRDIMTKTLNSVRLSGLTEQLRSENGANSETLAPKVATVHTKKSLNSEGDNVASLRAKVQIPHLSGLRISRPTGANTDGPKSVPQDNTKPSNVNQNKVVVGSRPSIADKFVGIEKQAQPIHSLKRKRIESPNMNVVSKSPRHLLQAPNMNVISKSPKHLLQSPVQRQTEENLKEVMEEEAHWNKNDIGNPKTSTPVSLQSSKLCESWEANLKELDVPYSMEKDSNVEQAEACTKELENICNLLRKKHEEAKEILVRAIVSNNKLLMLNHPMHDEKIRIVQRFAKQLTLKEI